MICSVMGGPLYHLPCHTVPPALVGGVLICELLLIPAAAAAAAVAKCTRNTDITESTPGKQWPALHVQYDFMYITLEIIGCFHSVSLLVTPSSEPI
jgi:hypothetical protein